MWPDSERCIERFEVTMAVAPAPGVALLRLSGTVGVNPWACVLHWYNGLATTWTQPQINSLATAAESAYTANLKIIFAQDVILTTIQTADLSDLTDRSAEITGLALTGGEIGVAPTVGSCVLVNHKINARYRGGHPRTYLPPGAVTSTQDGDTWTTGMVSNATNSWGGFVSAINTSLNSAGLAAASQCCPRWQYTYTDNPQKHKYTKAKGAYVGPFPISGFIVSNQIRSQRRRMGP